MVNFENKKLFGIFFLNKSNIFPFIAQKCQLNDLQAPHGIIFGPEKRSFLNLFFPQMLVHLHENADGLQKNFRNFAALYSYSFVHRNFKIKNIKMAKEFKYQEPFPLGKEKTEYYLLTKEHVSVSEFDGQEILKVEPEALTVLARAAMRDCSFLLRPEHQRQVASILSDPEASENDKYVALTMLRNAEIAAKGILPFCQDTGTATVYAKKGSNVWTNGTDEEALSKGIYETYTEENLRYSQNAALNMYDEVNTGTNLPAQIDLVAGHGNDYKFLFIAKGGGSANKSYLFQETKALLNPASLEKFLTEKMKTLGTAACPPYHIAFVIGGTSADACMKTVKLASTKYYDELPTEGNELGQAFRDVEMEQKVLKQAQASGFGAQFGGKYFAHDVRIVRLSRHGASCFVGMAVSCSADRNIKGKINKDGIWLERMESNPGALIPEELRNEGEGNAVKIDLNLPMKEILATLSKYPVATRLSLNGTIVVGRDIAHAKLKELIDAGKPLPQYVKDHPIYYAGPAKTPKGMPSGSFGPTTAGRMDSYVDLFQENGGSLIMIAKGNRTQQVTDACKKYGGFYLGSIGGPAAILAQQNIKKVECLEYPELGMEAIWKIEVENFPAFILVDDKGNDFFKQIKPNMVC
jgi:fumarate hydratase class I